MGSTEMGLLAGLVALIVGLIAGYFLGKPPAQSPAPGILGSISSTLGIKF